MNNIKIYDIESYHNFFCIGIKDYQTKEKLFYEISEEKNDVKEIHNYFTKFDGFLVSVNGIHYDNVVVKALIKDFGYIKDRDWRFITEYLKKVSDTIINDDYDSYKQYKWWKVKWTDIDLFCYWSKMLRISKKLSLKSLAVQLGYDVIQELPYSPETILKKEDLPKLRNYNLEHDLGITELLFERMKEDVELRAYVLEEYGLSCWSMDAPKIASEYLLEYYCEKTYPFEYRNLSYRDEEYFEGYYTFQEYKKQTRDFRYIPNEWTIGDYLPQVNFKTDFFKNIYNKIKVSTNNFQYADSLVYKQKSGENVKLSISSGGIHTVNNNQIFKETKDYFIIDADVAGLVV